MIIRACSTAYLIGPINGNIHYSPYDTLTDVNGSGVGKGYGILHSDGTTECTNLKYGRPSILPFEVYAELVHS